MLRSKIPSFFWYLLSSFYLIFIRTNWFSHHNKTIVVLIQFSSISLLFAKIPVCQRTSKYLITSNLWRFRYLHYWVIFVCNNSAIISEDRTKLFYAHLPSICYKIWGKNMLPEEGKEDLDFALFITHVKQVYMAVISVMEERKMDLALF